MIAWVASFCYVSLYVKKWMGNSLSRLRMVGSQVQKGPCVSEGSGGKQRSMQNVQLKVVYWQDGLQGCGQG